jgi:catechol 2,3-dioxygenase-like lactoylglutathione lyase family enzyme
MALQLTHIALHVDKLEDCIAFYRTYCDLVVVHERPHKLGRIVWMASPGHEEEIVMVIIPGGRLRKQPDDDFSHLGFAVEKERQVDEIADRAKDEKCLLWKPRREPFPVGYYCGVYDPDGNAVEFSYGQPLGPGAQAFLSSR